MNHHGGHHAGMDPSFFPTPADFRAWFAEHHESATELWVGFHKKGTGKPSITWPESVDQALCFGWIDGIRKSLDADSYVIRFTRRQRRSHWSNVNIKRIGELTGQGLVTDAGLRAFEARSAENSGRASHEQGTVELPEEYLSLFRANAAAWEFFGSTPPGYRRTMTWWVISAKREETRRKRLATLIEASANGHRVS
jgi:uncharacterized protein YdeI (YjbR/CyaY-like superfamily)